MENGNKLVKIQATELKPDICYVSPDITALGTVENAIKKASHRLTLWACAKEYRSSVSNDDGKKHIENSNLIIFDITNASHYMMLDIGFAFAVEKPIIFIASNSRLIPNSLLNYPVLIYEIDNFGDFSDRLSKQITRAIENPQQFTNTSLLEAVKELNRVFISYSHNDTEYLDRILIHLKPLEKMDFLMFGLIKKSRRVINGKMSL